MAKFFETLLKEDKICEYAVVFDWLLDDMKFSSERKWTKRYIGKLTTNIKKLDGMDVKDNIKHVALKKISFPENSKKENEIIVLMGSGESFARSLIRHIRNGIAHGNAFIYNNKGIHYLKIKDYSSNKKTKQTAFINIPLSYLIEIHKIYSNINKSIMNSRK